MGVEQNVGMEKEPEADFVEIFNTRMKEISPMPDLMKSRYLETLKKLGIGELIKEAPCMTFMFTEKEALRRGRNPEQLELWTMDPDDLEFGYPHQQVETDLNFFLNVTDQNEKEVLARWFKIGGVVLEVSDGQLLLFLNEEKRDQLENALKGRMREMIFDLLKRYGIKKVIVSGDAKAVLENDERIVNGSGMLDEIRKNTHYSELAKKHNLTNSQFLRLISRIESYGKMRKDEDYPVHEEWENWEDIIREIKEEDSERHNFEGK